MKIALATVADPQETQCWSGTFHFMAQALEENHSVEWVGYNLHDRAMASYNAQPFFFLHHFNVLEYTRMFSEVMSERIRVGNFDVVLCWERFAAAYLDVDIPVVQVSDTTFDLYKAFTNTDNVDCLKLLDHYERLLLKKTDLAVYSSEWAKNSAVEYYGMAPSKIRVIEFGANLPARLCKFEPKQNKNTPCHLLFVATRWESKGGDVAMAAYKHLKAGGCPVELTIVGVTPPDYDSTDQGITVIPYLDKAKEEDLATMAELLSNAHFLLLPTKFDCFGIVFCEASAFGVPSLAADVGGVSQVVRNGKNGFLLPAEATGEMYAKTIVECFSNTKGYQELCQNSRKEYDERLNWRTWALKITSAIEELIRSRTDYAGSSPWDSFFIPTYIFSGEGMNVFPQQVEEVWSCHPEFQTVRVQEPLQARSFARTWRVIVQIVQTALEKDDEIILLCEDDLRFTEDYSTKELFNAILEAYKYRADILLGGIGEYDLLYPLSERLYWSDRFSGMQFILLFRNIYRPIIHYLPRNGDTVETVLNRLSNMTVSCSRPISFSLSAADRLDSDRSKLLQAIAQIRNLKAKLESQ